MKTAITNPERDRVNFIAEQLGQHLRTARTRRGLTQEDVAGRIGVSLPTYRNIEAGKATTAIGHFISALTVMGLDGGLLLVANPDNDQAGLAISRRRKPIDNDF